MSKKKKLRPVRRPKPMDTASALPMDEFEAAIQQAVTTPRTKKRKV